MYCCNNAWAPAQPVRDLTVAAQIYLISEKLYLRHQLNWRDAASRDWRSEQTLKAWPRKGNRSAEILSYFPQVRYKFSTDSARPRDFISTMLTENTSYFFASANHRRSGTDPLKIFTARVSGFSADHRILKSDFPDFGALLLVVLFMVINNGG